MQLNEVLDVEVVRPEQPYPVAVAQVELSRRVPMIGG
jgi:hypothetical protein